MFVQYVIFEIASGLVLYCTIFLPPELFSPSPTQSKYVRGVSMGRSVKRGAVVDLMSHVTTSLGPVCVHQASVETSAIYVSIPSHTVYLFVP